MYTKPIIRQAIFLLIILLVAFILFAGLLVRGRLLSTLSATKQQQEKKAARVAARLGEKLYQARERVRILALNPLMEDEEPQVVKELLMKTMEGCLSCEALLVTDHKGSLITEIPPGSLHPYLSSEKLVSLPSRCELLCISPAGGEDHFAFACSAQTEDPTNKGRLIIALLNLNYVAETTLLGNKDDEVLLLADQLTDANQAVLLFAPEAGHGSAPPPFIAATFGPIIKEKAAPYLQGTAPISELNWTITVTKSFESFIAENLKTTFSGIRFTFFLLLPILIMLVLTIIAINHSRRYFKELALKDGLTSLYNHCFFQTELQTLIKRKLHRKISLLMLDLDNFKHINDTYGHQAGDEILQRVAAIMLENIRETDIAARYGGEEFAVILPGISLREALKVAERIRKAIKDQCACTISIGVSALPECATTAKELIKTADQALYRAKAKCKDRVEVAEQQSN